MKKVFTKVGNVGSVDLTLNGNPFISGIPSATTQAILLKDQSGVNIVPLSVIGNEIKISDAPKELAIYSPYLTNDIFTTIKIVTGSSGILTAINSTGLLSFTVKKNGTLTTVPITIVVNDVLLFEFTKTTVAGTIILTGTYA